MVSDFISEQDGYLKFSDQEFARACIEYGENKDGYWTSDRFMEQLEYSLPGSQNASILGVMALKWCGYLTIPVATGCLLKTH